MPSKKLSHLAIGRAQEVTEKSIERELKQRRKDADKRYAELNKKKQKPLRVYAEGDSWFDYPLQPRDVIAQIERLTTNVVITNDAHWGHEVRQMLGFKQRKRIIEQLSKKQGKKYEAILFSGGGNDITGDAMVHFIRNAADVSRKVEDALHKTRFKAAMDLVVGAYEDLIEIRDTHTQGKPPIFIHAYDFAVPDGRKVCKGVGPWLKPALVARGWKDYKEEQKPIGEGMLEAFASRLRTLANKHENVVFVKTQGLIEKRLDWHNELHPKDDGFETMAIQFVAALQKAFPGRVKLIGEP